MGIKGAWVHLPALLPFIERGTTFVTSCLRNWKMTALEFDSV